MRWQASKKLVNRARPAQHRPNQLNFAIGVIVSERLFDRLERLAANLLKRFGDPLIMGRTDQALHVDCLASFNEVREMAQNRDFFQVSLPGYLLNAVARAVQVQRHLACWW